MNITRAKIMTKKLMTDHGLIGWRFFFSSECQEAGLTWFENHVIEFSKVYFKQNNTRWCRDTVLHEIAHALIGLKHGHGQVWKAICCQIGATPYEYMEDSSIKSIHPKFKKLDRPDRELKLPKNKSKIINIDS